MSNGANLGARLGAAAELIAEGNRGGFLLDVGSDHAFLPIYLCASGKICGAVASDKNDGPVFRARKNIAESKLGDKIKAVRADGLEVVSIFNASAREGKPGEGAFTGDICIAGMGGILICEILKSGMEKGLIPSKAISAPTEKSAAPRLIVNGMRDNDAVRRLLAENGWKIDREAVVCDAGKYYQLFRTVYTGEKSEISDFEALFGDMNTPERDSEAFEAYKKIKIAALEKAARAKEAAGYGAERERKILSQLREAKI